MKQPEALTQQRLHELFDYDEGFLVFKVLRRSQIKVGDKAGHISKCGYINVRVDGRMYRSHRLIFLWHHGYLPDFVDHIDCDKRNNKIENLRSCTKSENSMNRARGYSKTGHRNVYLHNGKFQVHMSREGTLHYIGTFVDLNIAAIAAESARKTLFGEFA